MTGGARIENGVGDSVLARRLDFKHARFKRPRVEGNGFAGFQIDRQVRVTRAEATEKRNQSIHIVVRTRNVMAAAEVDPLHQRQQIAEFLLESNEHFAQLLHALFAEAMEVKAIEKVES